MKNLNFDELNVSVIKEEDLLEINGGGSGSENGARIAGRLVGIALFGPAALVYYAGCDLDIW